MAVKDCFTTVGTNNIPTYLKYADAKNFIQYIWGKLTDWLIVLHKMQPKGSGMKPILRETKSECSLVAYKTKPQLKFRKTNLTCHWTSTNCHISWQNESVFPINIRTYVIKFCDECMFNTVNKHFWQDYTQNNWDHRFNVSCKKKQHDYTFHLDTPLT